jgi:hypothetical protein
MNALYYIKHKSKIALLLLGLIAVILLSLQEHQNNLTEIKNNCNEIFKDRLLAHDYIYKLTENSYKKKIEVQNFIRNNNYTSIYDLFEQENSESEKIIRFFEKTKLTEEEKVLFIAFKKNQHLLKMIENKFQWSNTKTQQIMLLMTHDKITDASLNHLQSLSEIQLTEGKKLNMVSNKIAGYSDIFNQLNWGLVLIIGLSIQILIFASKSSQSKNVQNNFLN